MVQRSSIDRTCEFCNSTFQPQLSEVKRGGGKYCSAKCYHASKAIPLETHFRKGVGPTSDKGCIVWTGILDRKGYGIIYSSTHQRGQRTFLAHRVAWELANGPIPDGQCVLHQCDNPPCVNVDHLFLGTQLENIADMARKERQANRKLTGDAVKEIRHRYQKCGVSQQQLANEYGVDQTTISKVILNQSWNYV